MFIKVGLRGTERMRIMYEAINIAASGLKNQQRRLDTIADNIANINTVGFKGSRLDFKDALYTAGNVPGPPYTPDGNQQKGHGLMVSSITRDFSEGSLVSTGNNLDIAIIGDAFFELEDTMGNACYRRGGNLYDSAIGDRRYLVDSDGNFVRNTGGVRVIIPEGTTKIEVDERGTMTFFSGETPLMTDQLGIYKFQNKSGLMSAGGGKFRATEASGEAEPTTDATVKQGYLENSNVNLAEEMTRLIRAQRAFSLAGRALSTADQMEGLANNMKR
ncbi:MAG: flagellar hook-basal body protein [Clostridiales bacterium]|nr:flagellar hook-basal body protein [Clostridiales bacterium]